MTPDRWRQIEDLYHAARARQPNERAALLESTDPEIRSRVERMLEVGSGSWIIDQPFDAFSAESTRSQIASGTELGPYRIEEQIGAGGMGTVYRARDTRLGRAVAIKIASERYSERFLREARAISRLNHLHVCTLYDVGPNYLVMELLDGKTLKQAIQRGKIALPEVLRYGRQISDALAEAHSHGVIHRDLKPANIMLTQSGVKILDFGLAKVASAAQSVTDSQSFVGTPQYMAPEQVAGGNIGQAADLFALGLVLYEMAEGKPPLPGVSLGAAIANGASVKVPPLSDRSRAAKGLSSLISQLLDALPEGRPARASEVRDRLDKLAAASVRTPTRSRAPQLAFLVFLILLGIAGTQWSALRNAGRAAHVLRATRVTGLSTLPGDQSDPAFSPDGRSVAFSWSGEKGGNFDIYVMPVVGDSPTRLTHDPARDLSPAWSPDGHQIAFLRLKTVSKGSLVIVASGGGPERVLHEIALREDVYRAMRPLLSWTPDGKGVVYTTTDEETGRAGLYVADVQGSATRRLLSAGEGTIANTSPAFTRDGKWMAYTEVYGPFQSRLFVRRLSPGLQFAGQPIRVSGPKDVVIGSPAWSPSGQNLVYAQDANIFEWNRDQRPEQVYVAAARLNGMSAAWGQSEQVTVVTANSPLKELRTIQLRPGGLAVAGSPNAFGASTSSRGNPQFSPDGKKVAFVSHQSGASEVWVADSDARNPRQLTHLSSTAIGYPHWSTDGSQIAFHSWIGDQPQIFSIDVRASVPAAQVTHTAFGAVSPSWSADGRYIYFARISRESRMFRTPVQGGPIEDLFEASGGLVSPDGHRILYFKVGYPGVFSRALDGDPATNPEQKLVDDYKAPGDDLNPFPDGVYYISWNGDAGRRAIRFYSYAQKKSVDVFVLPGPVGSPQDLTVSPDRRRLVYHQLASTGSELSVIEFR